MDGTGELFAPLLKSLSPNLNWVVVRYPTESALGYAELGALAQQALPAHADVNLLAESFSGPIAISIAHGLGTRLKGLILCCTFATNPRPALNLFRPIFLRLHTRHLPIALVNAFMFGRFATPALTKLLGSSLGLVSTKSIQARVRAVMDVDVRNALSHIRVPVMYLRAEEDRLVPASAGAEIAQSLPQLQLREIQGPHALLQTRPNECAREIQAFIEHCNAQT